VFTTVADVKAYLLQFNGQGTKANPLPVPVAILAGNGDTWADLLLALQAEGEYVDLDLSSSTLDGMMTAKEFTPGTNNTGEKFVVCLTLPDTAESVPGGSGTTSSYDNNPPFRFFTVIREISGANITTIKGRAFKGRTSLTSVSFPNVKTVNDRAFENTRLSTLYLPEAETITWEAFMNCSSLKSVNLPALKTLTSHLFMSCPNLKSVSVPGLMTMNYNIFSGSGSYPTIITINGGVNFTDNSAIHHGFQDYYIGKDKAGGIYTYGQLGWTGPF
jgi:hypothetical protein